jgi:hypothetical protein
LREFGERYGMHYSAESSLWGLYSKLVAEGAPLSMRKVSQRSEIFPVFRERTVGSGNRISL